MRKIILCDSVPYAFGPVSKLIAISRLLRDDFDLVFLTTGMTRNFIEQEQLGRIVECNTRKLTDLEKNTNLFKQAALFLDVMNQNSVEFAQKIGTKVAFVDSLFWMWSGIWPYMKDVDYYFIQNFGEINDQIEKFKIKNSLLVGPIIENVTTLKANKSYDYLISFGGIESFSIKVGENTNYPIFMTKLLIKELEAKKATFAFTGNKKIMEMLKKEIGKDCFFYFTHEEFLSTLKNAKIAIVTPGLTCAFEIFSLGKKVLFLPPQNYSQVQNLTKFREYGIAKDSIDWSDIYPGFEIPNRIREREGDPKLQELMQKFDVDFEGKQKFGSLLRKKINSVEKQDPSKTKKFIDSLGTNGTETIAKKIREILA
ncbi:MAG: hypothetical protein PHD05_00925 [Sphaerochaetaceae bacterium]|nr:hypothetical protein [Sphaerochaetaceae bacterium]